MVVIWGVSLASDMLPEVARVHSSATSVGQGATDEMQMHELPNNNVVCKTPHTLLMLHIPTFRASYSLLVV